MSGFAFGVLDRPFRAWFVGCLDTQGVALGWYGSPRCGWGNQRMKLETFFEKFDQFADAPDAVAKMRELVRHGSANGAPHTSLGQRHRKTVPRSSRALKGRANVPALGGCLRRRCGRSARSRCCLGVARLGRGLGFRHRAEGGWTFNASDESTASADLGFVPAVFVVSTRTLSTR